MTLVLSGPIRRFVQFQDEFTYDAATPRDALAQLVAKYPQLRPVLFDEAGSVRKVHRMFLNSVALSDVDSALTATDRVEIITAIAGG
jgi:sulfur-carrier protein